MSLLVPKIIIILLAVLGVVISAILRYKKKNNQTVVCPLDGNCDTVIYSPYSRFFGVDLTILGIAYYAATAIFYTILAAAPGLATPGMEFMGFLVSLFAVGFSAYLIVVQGAVLHSWCTWCLGSAILTAGIFGIALQGIYGAIPEILAQFKTIIVILHAFSAALGVGAVTLTDILFFKFLKDYKISRDEADTLHTISEVIWIALVLLIVTGIALYIPRSEQLLESTKFLAKMFIVGVIAVNGVFLNLLVAPRLMRMAFGTEGEKHPGERNHLRGLAFALGAVSIVSWYSAFILGSLRSINLSAVGIIGIYLALLLLAVIGSQIFERRLAKRYN